MPTSQQVSVSTDNAIATTTLKDKMPAIPLNGPQGMKVIGPRVTFHFISDEWNKANTYESYDVVNVEGVSYVAIQPVPAEIDINNTNYWFKWSEPNAQLNELNNIVTSVQKNLDATIDDVNEIYVIVDETMKQNDIQNLIDNYDNILFTSGTYNLNTTHSADGGTRETNYCFKLKTNSNIKLENASLKINTNSLDDYSILYAVNAKNIRIHGNGKLIGDIDSHESTSGEWGYGVLLYSCENVKIEEIEITGTWGDGIAVGALNGNSVESKNISIYNVKINNCSRNGITIAEIDGIYVNYCDISNINRIAPKACIDIESNITSNLKTQNNIFISNCVLSEPATSSIEMGRNSNFNGDSNIFINNCVLFNTINADAYNSKHINISNCIVYCNKGTTILAGNGEGSIKIDNCIYIDPLNLNVFNVTSEGSNADINSIYVINGDNTTFQMITGEINDVTFNNIKLKNNYIFSTFRNYYISNNPKHTQTIDSSSEITFSNEFNANTVNVKNTGGVSTFIIRPFYDGMEITLINNSSNKVQFNDVISNNTVYINEGTNTNHYMILEPGAMVKITFNSTLNAFIVLAKYGTIEFSA